MFHFCIADTEHDWREGTEQYKFIEHCLASVDRQKQPWLIFLAHRVLGYSSGISYAVEGSFEEPMGRESLQKLWQKYKVDIAVYGHVHNYERTCPIYQVFIISAWKRCSLSISFLCTSLQQGSKYELFQRKLQHSHCASKLKSNKVTMKCDFG